MFESPSQIENLIHTSSAWAEATLAAARADIAGGLATPQEQRDEDLGRNVNQADASVIATFPSVTFSEQGKDHRLGPVLGDQLQLPHLRDDTVQPWGQNIRALLEDLRGGGASSPRDLLFFSRWMIARISSTVGGPLLQS